MTSLSFIECCRLLDIDPKTLRQWLAQAQMSLHAHPTDARIKCLTGEQIYVLTSLHDRVLQAGEPALTSAIPKPEEAQCRIPPAAVSDTDLRTRLSLLETQVAALQAQRDFPGDPTPQGAGAAHRTTSARSGSSAHQSQRATASTVSACSARRSSNTFGCSPCYQATNLADPTH
jgi:hypothetical protein